MANKYVGVEIEGLDELQDKLNRLPPEFSRRAIRTSLRPGARVLLEAIEIGARRLTGWMASQLFIRVKTNNLDEGTATVSFTRKTPPGGGVSAIYEALYQEFGTLQNGKVHVPAKPFIRPAFESSKGQALDKFVDSLKDELGKTFK